MVLEQDKAQYNESARIIAEREYQRDLQKYKEDEKKYQEDLAEYNKQQAEEKAKQEKIDAEAKRIAKAKSDHEADIKAKVNAFRIQWWRQHPGYSGSTGNRAVHEYEYKLRGGTQEEWNKLIVEEDANRKNALRQSAGLRAQGNAEIKQANQVELSRLGSTGTSNNQGPTLDTFPNGRAQDAQGTAAKAQDFPSSFQKPVKPKEPANNAERFAAIATPGTSLKSKEGVAQPTIRNAGMNKLLVSPLLQPYLKSKPLPTNSPKLKKDVIEQNKRWDERTKDLLTSEQQSKKASDSFAELNKPQEISRYTPWVIGDKGFFSKEAAENQILQTETVPITPTPTNGMYTLIGEDGKNLKDKRGNELQFKTAASAQRYADILNQKDNALGYTRSGQPVQGPTQSEPVYSISVPTLEGKTNEVDLRQWQVGDKLFGSEKQANEYIEKQEAKKPLTTSTLPGVKELFEMVDTSAKENKRLAEENPNDVIAQIMAGGSAIQSGILNMAETGRGLAQRYVTNQYSYKNYLAGKTPPPTRQVASPVTFDTVGMERATEGIKTTSDLRQRINPLNPDNAIARYSGGAQEQMSKQTWQQNFGQGVALAPLIAYDVVTGFQAGTGLLRQIGTFGSKAVAKVALKGTVKSAKALAVEGAPESVWVSKPARQLITYEGQRFENPVPNPYGKERTIPYKIRQGVEYVKNIKSPIRAPYAISNAVKTAGADLQYAKFIIKKNIPALPSVPQAVKDARIRLQLGVEDLKTSGGIIKRQTALNISRGIDVGRETLYRGANKIQPVITPFVNAKYRIQLGVQSARDIGSDIQRVSRIQYGKAKIPVQIFKRNQGIAFQLAKRDTIQKFSIIKSSVREPIIRAGRQVKTPLLFVGGEIKRPLLDAKYRVQLGVQSARDIVSPSLLDAKYRTRLAIQDFRERGAIPKRQFQIGVSRGIDVGREVGQRAGKKIRFEISETRKGVSKLFGDEYKETAILPYRTKNELRNITRTETFADAKPSEFGFIKRDKSAVGRIGKRDITESSKAVARQKETLNDVLFDIGQKGRKGMNVWGKFPGIRNAYVKIYADRLKVTIRNTERNRMRAEGKPDIATGRERLTDLLDSFKSKNPVSGLRTTDAPRINFGLLKTNTVKGRIGALPKQKKSRVYDFSEEKKILKNPIDETLNAKNILTKSEQAEIDKIFARNKARAEGTPEIGGDVFTSYKSIQGAPKSKVTAKEFDGIGNTKISIIKKPAGDRRLADRITEGMEMFNVKRRRTATKIDRIKSRADITVNDITKLQKQRRLERSQAGKEPWSIGNKSFNDDLKKLGLSKKKPQPKKDETKRSGKFKTDKELEKEFGKPDSRGMITKTQGGMKPQKIKSRVSPDSPKPQTTNPSAASPAKNNNKKPRMSLLPPIAKINRKKKRVTPTRNPPPYSEYAYATEHVNISSLRSSNRLSANITPKSTTKTTPMISTKIASRSAIRVQPKLSTKQPQKSVQKERFKTPAPERASPRLASRPAFKSKQPQRMRFADPKPEPIRGKVVGAALPPIDRGEKKKKKSKKIKEHNFLGNVQQGNIEGFFKRNDIIVGDKRIRKQERKDLKFKEKGKKIRIF